MNRKPFLSLSVFSGAIALASVPAGTAQAAVPAVESAGASLQVMAALFIVLAVMLVLYALLKKRFSIINPRSTKAIRVLEIQPLMPRKAICLIEVRGRQFLIGVANESVNLLVDLDRERPASFKEMLNTSQTERQP
ncbi:MAG: flagellar biosynthetic protein FliO [Desulfopila sp.]